MDNEVEEVVLLYETKSENLKEHLKKVTFEEFPSVCRCCLTKSDSLVSIELKYEETILRELFEKYTCLKVTTRKKGPNPCNIICFVFR